jgi:hypothetical protein
MRALLLLPLCLLAWSSAAPAEVRRCKADDGTTIYTDLPCDHFKALEIRDRPAPASSAPASTLQPKNEGRIHVDCARTPTAFLFDLRRALEYADVNALAGLYHWPGAGNVLGVMNRLERLAKTSGGTADLVYPEAAFVVSDPDAFPGLPPEDPEAVQIGTEEQGERLGLIQHAGCWWLKF